MADSFADLWNSTAPTKPAAKPQTLGTAARSPVVSNRPKNDVFSMLASTSSSSQPNSRPITPSLQPRVQNARQRAKQQTPDISNGDAFSSLLGGTIASNTATLSIAERQAAMEKERQERATRDREANERQQNVWHGLDAIVAGTSTSVGKSASTASKDDDWGLGSFSAPITTTSPKPETFISNDDDWGISDFAAPAPSLPRSQPPLNGTPPNTTSSTSLFDALDEHSSRSNSKSPIPVLSSSSPSGSRTPGDFDFGDREDRLLDGDSSGDEGGDDILGDLGKPVELSRVASPHSPNSDSPAHALTQRGSAQRSASPPPHVIGQIVEMGFSPQQARVALAATDTGLDVQQALETLLAASTGGVDFVDSSGSESQRERERERAAEEEEARRRRRRHPTRENGVARPETSTPGTTSEVSSELQERADRLLAQASEIGLSVFSRANAFWKEGKEKVQKVYEERAGSAGTPKATANQRVGRDGGMNSRPKWMVDAAAAERMGDGEGERGTRHTGLDEPNGRFRDDDDDGSSLPIAPAASGRRGHLAPAKTAGLLGEASGVYISPSRRRPAPPPRTSSGNDASTSSSTSATPHVHPPSPPPLRKRTAVVASLSSIASSNKHKAIGSEMFRLGRYAEAETAYTSAIASLPSGHLLTVPLHNNRSLARIKTGDHTGAVEDCTEVITLIGINYHPAQELKVAREEEGASVKLADGLVKAYCRRAEAFEGREKWSDAQKDWEAVMALEWAGKARTDAFNGAGRCRRMVAINTEPGPRSIATQHRKAPPVTRPKLSSASAQSSKAVDKLRSANLAQEEEEQARHELKDRVDAKLLAWKGGKETNLRALIASLDSVVWPELGLQKVSMGELVSEKQVKMRYTKAIAKLHPDKLNAGNTTLENRMVANAVFSALNDAWNAFLQ